MSTTRRLEPSGDDIAKPQPFLSYAEQRRIRLEGRWHTAFAAGFLVLLGGYAILDRGFAYVKPPGPVFLSEVVLLVGLIWLAMRTDGARTVIRHAPQTWTLLAFMGYGALRLLPGLAAWGFPAARDSALWYYGLLSILVAASVLIYPGAVDTALKWYARFLPFLLLWLPIGVFLARRTDQVILPSGVSLLSSKSGNAAVHAVLGLAFVLFLGHRYFRRETRAALAGLALIDALIASTQARGGLLGLLVALGLLAVFLGHQRASALAHGTAFVVVVGAVLLVTGLSVPTARDREISADQFADNFASVLSGGSGDDSNLANTADWRRDLWSNVYNAVGDEDHVLIGFGFGPNLGSTYLPRLPREVRELRTPHNSHLDVYARMGIVGVGAWLLVWLTFFVSVGGLAVRGLRRSTTESVLASICVIGVAATLINAIVDPTLEGPQVAFWAWGLHGLGTALWIRSRMSAPPPIDSATIGAADRREYMEQPT